ncbi:flagellar export protein FliJ [Curtobacterium sp. MCPF17_002]|uniref:flagellar export protein FliJ n=1 Tax=Curtobacterium sp. MCPF17_002 TaxID=2175645 RepID=UPI000DAA595F|nr:flagellar export protein FliJ [Curtobacterium sp. MCPF17_002]WIB79149.1 flagellar export protein FliJ [Curtobacterium sp. MCPF17_002]
MARRFPLAGLLRLRHAEQDRAAAALATANERVRDAADARIAARRSLADADGAQPIQDAATLSAVAAARAATRGMLEELDAVVRSRRSDADQAQDEYNGARRSALGLEKLEVQHVEQQTAEDLRTEQNALDEIAARRRAEGGAR